MTMDKSSNTMQTLPVTEATLRPLGSSRKTAAVATTKFAGRLGGNQEFIADTTDDDAQSLLKRQADAVSMT